ncbi:hypothetical protein Mp_4g05330 [Marchantia polymorpha subsp. ruderalis]|uniref:Uncharacterized protein n=2 Tax=Marchantia polymorpha TaxID=3197 RepID=A0AAF6B6L4_MARPO|nr:hypothetical protein MARPO_0087s0056 [Marchantia polymorpha]BBN07648.1 hypothetical protein Mp_4g05330 [Marchantia polymorpha subsp. ruderalis]|eukprot:PTQ33623.1 hypothetical protein MARPO_0087s0056 [Marchantia polymorpha]
MARARARLREWLPMGKSAKGGDHWGCGRCEHSEGPRVALGDAAAAEGAWRRRSSGPRWLAVSSSSLIGGRARTLSAFRLFQLASSASSRGIVSPFPSAVRFRKSKSGPAESSLSRSLPWPSASISKSTNSTAPRLPPSPRHRS